jgi:hypothetical protein
VTTDILCIIKEVLGITTDVLGVIKEVFGITADVLGVIVDFPRSILYSLLYRNLARCSAKITVGAAAPTR